MKVPTPHRAITDLTSAPSDAAAYKAVMSGSSRRNRRRMLMKLLAPRRGKNGNLVRRRFTEF